MTRKSSASARCGFGTEHNTNDTTPKSKLSGLRGERVGGAVNDQHWDMRARRRPYGDIAQVRLGLNRQHLTDLWWVVTEVEARPRTDLDAAARRAREELVAVFGCAFGFAGLGHARVPAGEQRMTDRCGHTNPSHRFGRGALFARVL